jgi:general secretion pathway protein F
MPHFQYRAVTAAGEMVIGEVDAPTREEVVRRIEYLGHMAIEAELVGKASRTGRGHTIGKAPNAREVTVFLRQLALLVGAGLTLEAALSTLAEDTSKPLARFANGLRAKISAGDSFGEALEDRPGTIQPAYVAMVRAGEAAGKLEAVLSAVVEDRTRQQLLAERINSAIRYPTFLVGSATLVLFVFIIYVVPQFEPVFKDLGNRLNGGAALALAASGWLHAHAYGCLSAVLALLLAGWLTLRQREMRQHLIASLARLPGVATPMRDRRTARIVGTLGLLVKNGVALPTTLKILRDVVDDPPGIAAIDHLHEQVRNGRRFSDALAETDLLPSLAIRMLRVGEETGDLASIAAHAAQFYEHRLGIGLDRLMGAIGPATIILVSLLIGSLVISIMSALLSITELAL